MKRQPTKLEKEMAAVIQEIIDDYIFPATEETIDPQELPECIQSAQKALKSYQDFFENN